MKARIIFFLLVLSMPYLSFSNYSSINHSCNPDTNKRRSLSGFSVRDVCDYGRRRKCEALRKERLLVNWIGHGAFYVGTYIPLYSFWYKYSSTSSFHFFNDGAEWRGMDKLGHSYTAFKLAGFSNNVFDWAYPENSCSSLKYGNKKTWISSGYAMLYLTTMEMLDGFSSGWGFSGYDMLANTFGVGLFATQKILFKEIFIRPKFSYHATPYPNYRPETLGYTPLERGFKDYNGQTYWLSVGLPSALLKSQKFKWIACSFGYSVDGLTGGSYNPLVNENGVAIPNPTRTSSYFLSMDIDWERMKCFDRFFEEFGEDKRKKWLRILCIALNTVKLPFPALEFKQGGGIKVHALYF